MLIGVDRIIRLMVGYLDFSVLLTMYIYRCMYLQE